MLSVVSVVRLRYIVFIYNAQPGKTETSKPDVTVQTQFLRGNNIVLSSPARPISTEGQDAQRLPYAGEVSLNTLPAGRYELLVLIQDRISKTETSQHTSFEIE
jgi:hypothetical protein